MTGKIKLTWQDRVALVFAATATAGATVVGLVSSHEPREELGPLGGDKPKLATPADLAQLDDDLGAAGVHNFSARELTANRKNGRRVHYIPPAAFYPNLIAMAQLAQRMRDLWGGPLITSSAYRPQDGRRSAHHYAKAIDLDLPKSRRTWKNRDRLYFLAAQEWLKPREDGGHFGGLGLYAWPWGRLHVDVARSRYWTTARARRFFARVKSGEPVPPGS